MSYHEGPVERRVAEIVCNSCGVVESRGYDSNVYYSFVDAVRYLTWDHEWRAIRLTPTETVTFCSAACVEVRLDEMRTEAARSAPFQHGEAKV